MLRAICLKVKDNVTNNQLNLLSCDVTWQYPMLRETKKYKCIYFIQSYEVAINK